MIFDIHAHIGHSKYSDNLITAEVVLKVMDGSGIDRAILLPTASTGKYITAQQMKAEVEKAPDRLVGFFSSDVKAKDAVDLFTEAVTKYGAKGMKIHPVYAACAADDEKWIYPLLERAGELKVPVMFHSGEAPYATPWQIGLAAMDFPKTTIILEHMGFDAMCFTNAAIKMAKKSENIILGTTGVMYEFPITKAVNAIGDDRIVYGGEIPMNNPLHEILKVKLAKISDEAKEKILGRNIARILNIPI
jgi:predicted TIM-barrel fold metal-dependent hydrolase